MLIRRRKHILVSFVLATFAASTSALAQDGGELPWLGLSESDRSAVEAYATGYKDFMHKAKTELSFVREAVRLARADGFSELTESSSIQPGARFYDVNRDRTVCMIVVGKKDLQEGFRVVGAHIDSPRLELKARPLYEKEGYAMFQTNYHGGLKTYQWTNLPLALMGRVDLKNGSTVWISVGNEPNEPTFIIPDLSPHVDAQLRSRTAREAIELEELDPVVGHLPKDAETSVKDSVTSYLRDTYEIGLDDLVSAELALVPAMVPRDVGFDRGLMAIYGQDDRLSGYAALKAALDVDAPEYTSIAYLVDNEEV